jgi:hypothetical protein
MMTGQRWCGAVFVTAVTLAAGLGGCGGTSEIVVSDSGGSTYTHRGMNFAVSVPRGWTVEELPGDLLVELSAPADESGRRAVAHVFSRREARPVVLGDATSGTVAEVLALMKQELRFGLGETPPPDVAAAEMNGLPPGAQAVRLVRTPYAGPTAVSQELTVVALGKQVWTLMLSVPVSEQEPYRAAMDEIRDSFRVW